MASSNRVFGRVFQRTVSAFLIAITLFSPVAEAARKSCPANLLPADSLELLDYEYAAAIKKQSGPKRFLIKLIRKRVRNRIIEACASRRVCNAETIAKTVEKEVKAVGGDTRKIRGYAILIAAMVAGAAVSSKVGEMIPANAQFMASLIGAQTAIILHSIGEPVLGPMLAWVRQRMFGISAETDDEGTVRSANLEEMWARTQASYNLNAQMSRNIINGYIGTVQAGLYILQDKSYALEDKRVVSSIAELIVRIHRLYADVQFDDPNVLLAVYVSIGEETTLSPEFAKAVRAKIDEFDRDSTQHENREFYDGLINTWLVERAH